MSNTDHKFYDKSYKNVFSHPKMIQDLLKGFVDHKFIKDIDLDNIEKINTSYVSKEYAESESDLIIKLNIKGKEAYLYLLLELQSTVDKFMAFRTLSYILGFYNDLLKQKHIKDKFPPVFPIVLYTGVDKYTAPIEIKDLIEHWEITDFIPTFKYYKIAVNEGKEKYEELSSADNVVAAYFQLISSGEKKEFKAAIRNLSRLVKEQELRREIFNFIKHFLIKKNIKIEEIPFEEGGLEMLETLIDRVKEEGYEEGRGEGRREGEFNKAIKIADELKKMNIAIEEISRITGLPIENLT